MKTEVLHKIQNDIKRCLADYDDSLCIIQTITLTNLIEIYSVRDRDFPYMTILFYCKLTTTSRGYDIDIYKRAEFITHTKSIIHRLDSLYWDISKWCKSYKVLPQELFDLRLNIAECMKNFQDYKNSYKPKQNETGPKKTS